MTQADEPKAPIEAELVDGVEAIKNKEAQGDFIKPTAKEEAAVIRKLDIRLLPLILILYTLAVLDRSNLGNAKLAGMQDEIDLSGNRYNWLGTIFCTRHQIRFSLGR